MTLFNEVVFPDLIMQNAHISNCFFLEGATGCLKVFLAEGSVLHGLEIEYATGESANLVDDEFVVIVSDTLIDLAKNVLDTQNLTHQVLHESSFKILQVLKLIEMLPPAEVGQRGDEVAIIDGVG